MNKVSTANRRGFLKKSLYSAPVVLALGHLTPSMVYGADGSGGFTTQQPLSAQDPVIVAGDPVPGAGSGGGSGNTGSGVTGSSTNNGGGSNGAGGANAPVANTDNNETK